MPDTNQLERYVQVLEWRDCDEWTYDEIGTELGVSGQRAHQLYEKAKRVFPAQRLEQRRNAARRRYGEIRSTLWDTANNCGPKAYHNKIRACEALIRLEDREAALDGLDMPRQNELKVISQDVLEGEIQRLTQEMSAMDAQSAGADAKEAP